MLFWSMNYLNSPQSIRIFRIFLVVLLDNVAIARNIIQFSPRLYEIVLDRILGWSGDFSYTVQNFSIKEPFIKLSQFELLYSQVHTTVRDRKIVVKSENLYHFRQIKNKCDNLMDFLPCPYIEVDKKWNEPFLVQLKIHQKVLGNSLLPCVLFI